MPGINKVFLLGNLGQDPSLKHTASGKTLCRFSLATSRAFRRGEAWEELTDWHDIVVWDQQAERLARRLMKGSSCLVEGRLAPRTWEDQEGRKRRVVDVVAERVVVLPSASARRSKAYGEPQFAGGGREEARSQAVLPADLEGGELRQGL